MRFVAAAAALLVVIGCNRGTAAAPVVAAVPPLPPDPWILATNDPAAPTPAYLSNGLIGLRIARGGGGLDNEGKPLGFFMIDEVEPAGEEKILNLPNPILVAWAVGNEIYSGKPEHDFFKSGGTPLDPRRGTDYRQELDMRSGILVTGWRQQTPEAGEVRVRCLTIVHPTSRVIAQRWVIQPQRATTYAAKTLDYGGPNDLQAAVGRDERAGIDLSASSKRVVGTRWKISGDDVAARVTSAADHIRVGEGRIAAGQPLTLDRVLSFGNRAAQPLPAFDGPKSVALLRKVTPPLPTFDETQAAAAKAWIRRWECDLVIDGPVEDQCAIHSFLFYLRSSIAPKANRSISPFALSNDIYNGHVFWDADTWVFPALALTDPDLAASIANYRLNQVVRGYESAVAGKDGLGVWRPKDSKKFDRKRNYAMGSSEGIAKIPWESSISGREVAPPGFRNEAHGTGDAARMLQQATELGVISHRAADQAGGDLANHYASIAIQTERGREIKNVMSPDENHVGDNDLYTNALAETLLAPGTAHKPGQTPIGAFYLPRDAKTFLTYDNDLLRSYKQAAAVLTIYPLQFPPAEAEAREMMDRFADKAIKNGPAMTDSVHATIWARLGERDKAYAAWRASWMPFTERNPLMLFAEKRSKPAAYFTTGAGGSLQTVLYGFLGFRLDDSAAPGAAWKTKLMDQILSIRPNLPDAWKSVTLKNFTVRGRRMTVTVQHKAGRSDVVVTPEG